MPALSPSDLGEKLLSFVATHKAVLFSGAGVGKRVGLPLWGEYLKSLADVCERYGDSDSAALIRKKVDQEDYLGAAGIYEYCNAIPLGESWKALAAPFADNFSDDALKNLKPLFGLPFAAVVTTNYDRSQHHAAALALKRSPIHLELADGTLKNTAMQDHFFIARIHGKSEAPDSMVLYPSSYKELGRNDIYKDFLLTLMKGRACMFIGFSFVDPAIRNVLETYEKLAGPVYQGQLHCALIPDSATNELKDWLRRLNFIPYEYSAADGHKALWKAVRSAYEKHSASPAKIAPLVTPKASTTQFSQFQRFFAFTFAQIQGTTELRPLLTQAFDGLVVGVLREVGTNGLSLEILQEKVRNALSISDSEAKTILRDTLARLIADGDLVNRDEKFLVRGEGSDLYGKQIAVLVKGTLDRLKVREAFPPAAEDALHVENIVERILLVRAWDLAAHYAGAGTGYGSDLALSIASIAGELIPSMPSDRRAALERSCLSMLTAPTDHEARALAELGRSAFALQSVLASPRQALLHKHTLPQNVYLDASILLPTIVPGHPLRPVYADSIKRLREAAKDSGVACNLIVGDPFLQEIVVHRDNAIKLVRELRLESGDNLDRHIAFYGAENTNVYVGAYSSHIGRSNRNKEAPMTFYNFLKHYAPYSSEPQLANFLERHGFDVLTMNFRKDHNREFVQVLNPLLAAYEQMAGDYPNKKERKLIEHEAQQIVQLKLDEGLNIRAIFVSADRRLVRAVMSHDDLRENVGAIVPPSGFVGLIDVMVGLKADRRSLARLVWASPRKEADQAVRDFLINRALGKYEVAIARTVPDIIEEVIDKNRRALKGKSLMGGNDIEDVARAAAFMDRVEDEFFELARKAIEKDEKERNKGK